MTLTQREDYSEAARNQRTWLRSQRLSRFGFKDYTAFVQSERWAATRARYWADPDTPKRCALCDGDDRLALHHKTYERVCDERLDDLAPLCFGCHRLVHDLEKRGDIELHGFDQLVSKARANRNRRDRLRREEAMPKPTTANLRDQRRIEARLVHLRKRVAEVEERGMTRAVELCKEEYRRRHAQLVRLRENPTHDLGRPHEHRQHSTAA